MTESKGASGTYLRLSLAYFCQFAIWGSWMGGALSVYAGVLELTGDQIGWLYAAMPLGALAGLIIGPVADRLLAAQKVMGVLHLIGGLALLICGWVCSTGTPAFGLLLLMMILYGICYTPTLGLINAIVFKHIPGGASKGPYVFVWGTLGWLASIPIVGWFGAGTTPHFFYVGGAFAVFLAIYSLTLPDTPPKGAPAPGEKSNPFAVLSMFQNKTFLAFIICVFFASILANNYYWSSIGAFWGEQGYDFNLLSLNQVSEILFMLALPFLVPRIGLKNVLLLGMAAWSIRYFCLMPEIFPLALVALLVHGICYSFLYVASYMYAEKMAPPHLKASAQTLMVILLVGIAQIIGGFAYGWTRDANRVTTPAVAVQSGQLITTDAATEPVRNEDGVTSEDGINGTPSQSNEEQPVVRLRTEAQVEETQKHDWAAIYRVPAIFIAVFFVIFLILGREPKDAVAEGQS